MAIRNSNYKLLHRLNYIVEAGICRFSLLTFSEQSLHFPIEKLGQERVKDRGKEELSKW